MFTTKFDQPGKMMNKNFSFLFFFTETLSNPGWANTLVSMDNAYCFLVQTSDFNKVILGIADSKQTVFKTEGPLEKFSADKKNKNWCSNLPLTRHGTPKSWHCINLMVSWHATLCLHSFTPAENLARQYYKS